MPSAKKLLKAIDDKIIAQNKPEFRTHLGASVIGHECLAYSWFTFRWAKARQNKAAMCRLLDRGHREEERFVRWLRDADVTVWDKDENGNQFRVSDCEGHLGGSLDGVGKNFPDFKLTPALTEFKTHGEKSFKDLVKKGVQKSKPRHYDQMQVYMYKAELKIALYMAINKNNDELHLEWVRLDPAKAASLIERGRYIIFSDERPLRLSNKPSWYECKWCAFHKICHYGELPAINCRTCAHSTPVENKQWSCQRIRCAIKLYPKVGCHDHVYNPHMLNRCEMVGCDKDKNYIELLLPDKRRIKNGPHHVPSTKLDEVITRG